MFRQVHTRNAHHAPILHRIGNAEHAGIEAGFLVEVGWKSEAESPHAFLERFGVFPAVHLGEAVCLENQNLIGKEINEVAIRRKEDARAIALLVIRPRDGVGHDVLSEIVSEQDGRSDLEPVDELGVTLH